MSELLARIVTGNCEECQGCMVYHQGGWNEGSNRAQEDLPSIHECRVHERLQVMLTTDKCNVQLLTDWVLTEQQWVGFDTVKILSQCYDGASVMLGKVGGMQWIIQDRLHR